MSKNEFIIYEDHAELIFGDGMRSQVDLEDVGRIKEHKWWNMNGRPATTINGRGVRLHQFLLPTDKLVDHRDRNGLNNRKNNLREATHSLNAVNKLYVNALGFRGVIKMKKRYRACIKHHGVPRGLGMYDTPEEAARAYDKAAREVFGEFAVLNFPDEI